MNSKMREALRDFIQEWERRSGHPDPWVLIDEIAQRYGPLEFTREEVRGMLVEAIRKDFGLVAKCYLDAAEDSANKIISRHTEAGGEPTATCGDCGRELEEVRPGKHQCTYCEIVKAAARDLEDRLTHRLAAIEKRLLADGHSEGCTFWAVPGKCTCGHNKIRENTK